MSNPLPGWYQFPDTPGFERYWSGTNWTADTRPMIPSPQASAPPAVTKATLIKNPVSATLLALFGFAALVFGAVGDLSDDQYYDAPQSTAYVTMFSGALGLAIVVFSLTALFRITRAAGRSVLPYLVLPFIAGAAIGAGLRVVTAHTADANIGAGFVLLLGPLLVLPMLVGAIVVSNRLLPSRTAAAGVKPSGVSTWPVRALVLGSVGLVSPVLTIVLSIFVGWLSLIVTLSGPLAMGACWKATRVRITRRELFCVVAGFVGGSVGTIWFMMCMIDLLFG